MELVSERLPNCSPLYTAVYTNPAFVRILKKQKEAGIQIKALFRTFLPDAVTFQQVAVQIYT